MARTTGTWICYRHNMSSDVDLKTDVHVLLQKHRQVIDPVDTALPRCDVDCSCLQLPQSQIVAARFPQKIVQHHLSPSTLKTNPLATQST